MTAAPVALLFFPAAPPEPAPLAYAPAPADNPLKGLAPYREPRPGRFPYAMEFSYLPLSDLMTGPDEYDWAPLEALLNDVASRGRHTVFRVFLEYPGEPSGVPKFLTDAGVETVRWNGGGDGATVTPDYADPRVRDALTKFVAALGEKYDGDPRIGYVTAGLLGKWGEWHDYPREELFASKSVQRAVLDAYAAAFRKTPVLLRYPAGAGDDAYAKTAGRPFGYHDDSFAWATLPTGREEDDWFFVPKLEAAGLGEVWKKHPIGGEIRPEVWGCAFDDPPCTPAGQSFAACRDRTHVTWLMDTGMNGGMDGDDPAPPDRRARAIEQVRKMGYEFHVATAAVGDPAGGSVPVRLTVTNAGIAPFYHPGWTVRLALLPAAGGAPVAVTATDWSLRELLPGDEPRAWAGSIPTAGLPAGEYRVLVGVPSNLKTGPPLRFANAAQDAHAAGWLTVGTVTLP